MAFKAKPLMVQLPCGPVTVIEPEQMEAERAARKFWRDLLDCPRGTGQCRPTRPDMVDLEHLTDHVCFGTEPLVVRTIIEASALPVLREQLKARIKEIDAAQKAVERKEGSG